MDKITIRDLEVFYRIGVPEAERAKPQRLSLTIEMLLDFSKAAANDDLAQTIDYDALSQRLVTLGNGREWKLIETLAVDIAEMVLRDTTARSVTVEVKKFILPETRYVGVTVTRSRSVASP